MFYAEKEKEYGKFLENALTAFFRCGKYDLDKIRVETCLRVL